jgi:hypothetical protein
MSSSKEDYPIPRSSKRGLTWPGRGRSNSVQNQWPKRPKGVKMRRTQHEQT